ncbi:Transposon Ty3-G Gag-Pol polyprotein [Gossypium australe]|uniref:Transposon Ty3-G Gag-Pol polyprotein n=1 Tax=Gossypium australe TaxID=47621 RepID=A0A5B6VM20_9ROSI|nr:Transposon Ty3-G Gag-Pol polyprotein [Gossypium australe]
MVPSVIKPPKLELKLFPKHLKYGYLGEQNTLPVIIAGLDANQEEALLRVLKMHKKAMGWTIHRIRLEEGKKPAIKEVVKKELLQWLNAYIVYAISDSEWVSPTQVPKKGGLIVVENDKNELISTRTFIDWRVKITIVFLMGTKGTIKSQSILMTKGKLISRALLVLMPLKESHLVYATL